MIRISRTPSWREQTTYETQQNKELLHFNHFTKHYKNERKRMNLLETRRSLTKQQSRAFRAFTSKSFHEEKFRNYKWLYMSSYFHLVSLQINSLCSSIDCVRSTSLVRCRMLLSLKWLLPKFRMREIVVWWKSELCLQYKNYYFKNDWKSLIKLSDSHPIPISP